MLCAALSSWRMAATMPDWAMDWLEMVDGKAALPKWWVVRY
jgi:hypothetical protein